MYKVAKKRAKYKGLELRNGLHVLTIYVKNRKNVKGVIMRKTFSIPICLVFFFILTCSSYVIASEKKDVKYELKWGTIVAGGAWQILGNAMLEDIKKANPNITGSCIPSTPTATLMGIHQGKYNIGFSLTDATASAWEGEDFFKPTGPIKGLRALTALYPQATHIVVWAKSDITKIEHIRGKRVSPGARGLSNDLESQRLLKLYNMTYNDMKVQFLSFEDAATQFIDGHLDALLFLTSYKCKFSRIYQANTNPR